MPSQIGKLKYVFVLLLGLISASILAYSWLYSIPNKKCEAAEGWFSWKYRKCYAPIAISTITGRKPGEPVKVDFHDDARKASNARAVRQADAPAEATAASR